MVAAIGVLLLLMRRNSTLFFGPQLWAEDLFVYFNEDRLFGIAAVTQPSNGYVQVSCRLIALVAGMAPAEYSPRLYAMGFIGAIALTAILTFTSPTFQGWGKALATLTLVGAPVSSEVFLGMLYTHWVLGPIVALALYERPTSRSRQWWLGTAFALVGFSSPFTLIASPLIAWKAIRERTVFALSLVLLTFTAGLFHLPNMVTNMVSRVADYPKAGSAFERVSISATVFYRWLVGGSYPGFFLATAISILSATVLAWYLWANRRTPRPWLYFFMFGVALLVVSCYTSNPALTPNQFGHDGRYFYIPAVLFIWTFIFIEQNFQRKSQTFPIAAAVLSVLFVANVRGDARLYGEDDWPKTVICLKQETICATHMNPQFLGTRLIPTDFQIRTFSLAERRQFSSIPK